MSYLYFFRFLARQKFITNLLQHFEFENFCYIITLLYYIIAVLYQDITDIGTYIPQYLLIQKIITSHVLVLILFKIYCHLYLVRGISRREIVNLCNYLIQYLSIFQIKQILIFIYVIHIYPIYVYDPCSKNVLNIIVFAMIINISFR